MNIIPPITDPLGKYWDQPSTDDILLDDTHCAMSESNFKKLLEYSTSIPSGAYEGKMWKTYQKGIWYLRWYGPHENPAKLSINSRELLIIN